MSDATLLIRADEAAALIGVSLRQLQRWRNIGNGPKFVKINSREVRYRRCDIDEWAASLVVKSSSEYLYRQQMGEI